MLLVPLENTATEALAKGSNYIYVSYKEQG